MLYYPLKKLRRDPQIFFKILFCCLIAHIVVLIFPMLKKLQRAPKRMPLISFMPPMHNTGVKLKVPYNHALKGKIYNKNIQKNNTVPIGINKTEPQLTQKVKPSVPAVPTAKKSVEKVASKIIKKNEIIKPISSIAKNKPVPTKQVMPKETIKSGTTSKLQLPEYKGKNLKPEIKKNPEPEKFTEKAEVPVVPEQKTIVNKMPDPIPAPELQTLEIGYMEQSSQSDEELVPDWFKAVRNEIYMQLHAFKFFKDIEEDFSYSALITINAQGKPCISDEAGCMIPVIRASIKKIYLEYPYPKSMWNKIWPIKIEKQK